jgi:hypothetical protein
MAVVVVGGGGGSNKKKDQLNHPKGTSVAPPNSTSLLVIFVFSGTLGRWDCYSMYFMEAEWRV